MRPLQSQGASQVAKYIGHRGKHLRLRPTTYTQSATMSPATKYVSRHVYTYFALHCHAFAFQSLYEKIQVYASGVVGGNRWFNICCALNSSRDPATATESFFLHASTKYSKTPATSRKRCVTILLYELHGITKAVTAAFGSLPLATSPPKDENIPRSVATGRRSRRHGPLKDSDANSTLDLNEDQNLFTFRQSLPTRPLAYSSRAGSYIGIGDSNDLNVGVGDPNDFNIMDNGDSDSEGEWGFEMDGLEFMDGLEGSEVAGNIAAYREDLIDHQLYQAEQEELQADTYTTKAHCTSPESRQGNLPCPEKQRCDPVVQESGEEDEESGEEGSAEGDAYVAESSDGESDGYTRDAPKAAPKRRGRSQPNPRRKRRCLRSHSPAQSPSPASQPTPTTPQSPTYAYGGVSCSCADTSHAVDSALPPHSPEHVDDDCMFMGLLKLKFHKFHRFLICPCNGGSFINLGALLSHFRDYHWNCLVGEAQRPSASRWDLTHKRRFEDQVVAHLADCLRISATQERKDFEAATLQGPIPGLADAVKRPQCPDCLKCYANGEVLRVHHSNTHSKRATAGIPFADVPVAQPWCQEPHYDRISRGPKKPRLNRYIIVPGRLPPASSTGTAAGTASRDEEGVFALPFVSSERGAKAIPRWLERLQWVSWVERLLGFGWTIPGLLSLIASPYARKKAKFPKEPATRRKRLDWVLRRIGMRLMDMAKDANAWLNTCSPETRGALSEGYVMLISPSYRVADITHSSRSQFRSLKGFDKYANVMRRPIFLSLRLIEAGSSLPSLGISRTQAEDDALKALHHFAFNFNLYLGITEEDDEDQYAAWLTLYEARLDELLHPVLYALLFRRLHPAQFLTNTVAVSLVLLSLQSDSTLTFKRGSMCTQNCAAFQYYVRTTAMHELRLKTDNHSTYVPPSGPTIVLQDKIESDDYSTIYEYVRSPRPPFTTDTDGVLGSLRRSKNS